MLFIVVVCREGRGGNIFYSQGWDGDYGSGTSL